MSHLRVLLVPITRQCYALHANTIYKSLSSVPMHDNEMNMNHYPANQLHLKHIPILNRIKSPRIRNLVDNNLNELHNFWVECEEKSESDPQSWKGHIPYKQLIINKEVFNLSYIIPNSFDKTDAINHLKAISKRRKKYHQKWLYLNVCLLPFTALLGLLPGPNIFILYNGFRCFGHYRAYHGAIAIDQNKNEFDIVEDDHLEEIYMDLQKENQPEIDDEYLHKLQKIFDCQHIFHHIHRIRYQIVSCNKTQRYQLIA
eukprot:112244_1